MKVLIVYFSATGNTAKMAGVIKEKFEELGAEVDVRDVTSQAKRPATIDMTPYQAAVFGAPIHSWRAPRVFREWLSNQDGKGMKCSMFFTYGGFQVHPTHYSTKQILEQRNFRVVSSAEFPGVHTFNIGGWKAMDGRPDDSDFDLAREYAAKTYRRFTGEDAGLLGEMEKTQHTEEFLDSIEVYRFKALTQLPTREGRECSMCMVCEEVCPTGAMNAEAGQAEKGVCIGCLACVANCPDEVLKINDMTPSWANKLKLEKLDEESMKKKTGKIYL